MLNDPKFPDVKICLHKRWCTPEHCGTTEKSKTITIAHFGADPVHPVACYLVLRSWMIYIRRMHGFTNKKSCRKKWLASEISRLSADIAALGFPGRSVGNSLADDMIRQWAPEVM